MRLGNPYILTPAGGGLNFRTYDANEARNFARQTGIKYYSRVHGHIPALKDFNIDDRPSTVETDNETVIKICLDAGMRDLDHLNDPLPQSHPKDPAAPVAKPQPTNEPVEHLQPAATVPKDAKPKGARPDFGQMTKAELVAYANDESILINQRQNKDEITKTIEVALDTREG
jgi:hypothetical protein